jgi:hypothetical protein
MKKCFLLLALPVFIFQSLHAQTNVSGGIYSNTTWTLANSPYIVVDTVVVFPGVTLTIEPGVVVKFDSSIQLEIRQAKIIANGTSSDSITFTSNSFTPVAGSYTGIYLNGGALVSTFNYCNFKYAFKGVYVDVSDSVLLNNSTFNQNFVGFQFYGSGINSKVALVNNCNFNYNSIGLDLETLGSAQINYCNFTYNTGDGLILIDSYPSSFFPRMDYCNFTHNGNGLLWYFLSSMINHCHFYNNVNAIIETGLLHNYYTYNNTIRNCIFDYNQIGSNLVYFLVDSCTAIHNQTGMTGGSCKILNCIIDSNDVIGINSSNDSIGNCQIRNNGIGIRSPNYTGIFGSNIEYNTLKNIEGSAFITGSTIRYSNFGIDDSSSSFGVNLTNNIIEYNNIGIRINIPPILISCNSICNNTQYGLQYGAITNIDVSHNYWCTSDSASTEALIYDGYDNINYGLASFMPIDSLCAPVIINSVSEIAATNSITVFPNPSSTDVIIQNRFYFADASLTLYNSCGQQVKHLNHLSGQEVILYRDNLESGLYFLRITENNKTLAMDKLVIRND